MGNACQGGPVDKVTVDKSRKIDQQIARDRREYNEEIKILLLGTGDSGKSTIAKQMKIIHLKGFSDEERTVFKQHVYVNVIRPIQALIAASQRLELSFDPSVAPHVETLSQIVLGYNTTIMYTKEVADSVQAVWEDPITQQIVSSSSEFRLNDSGPYFLANCQKFWPAAYIPDEGDILRVRTKTTGISETFFTIKKRNFRMVDVGGQRNERKKWIHCFTSVTAIIFCVAMNEYDLFLEEDSQVNRMHESLKLFGDIINNTWFLSTNIILFLNKYDLFEEKVRKIDLVVCFPNYAHAFDVSKARDYIRTKFEKENRSNGRKIYPHFTTATDTNNIRAIFQDIKAIFMD
eukprot:CAMPEP_0184341034 /NCGR_PEP_ID=MMETSP1089-20130417/9679_1 /TAXON_ID=38269 ORGANISM="Gloeochaete wittrockiana, Strain SAG46.84" /NCGR_SAMPLE_ID=MMETSP1089 /ASSEMBLY_ACC=CAM_ASM_000445 /LENGTH=346 /DNA_ID=CAMNT_0026669139 /DNA_START=211 /DNA_END=1248 /DNA_ORIENTATION=+